MAKHLIQAAIAATQVVGKAFVRAVRQEIAASQAAAARAGGGKAGAKHAATNTKLGMTLEEAKDILNVKDLSSAEEIQKSYEYLFKINDRTNGGTLYLQSKIFRAKERIDTELNVENQPENSNSSTANSSTESHSGDKQDPSR